MELFESLGVELKVERGRRVFPVSDKAEEILKFIAITGSNDLVQIVTAKKAGDTLKLSVYRQGQTLELTVTVAEQKQSALEGSSDTQQSQQQDQSQQQQQQGGGYGFPWGFGFGG